MVSTSGGGSRVVQFGIGMKRRDAKLQSDAQRLQQRQLPSASLCGRRKGEGRVRG